MRFTMIARFRRVAAAAPLALAACMGPEGDAADAGVRKAIATHYAAHASEAGGACSAPFMTAITSTDVVDVSGGRTTLRVYYRYSDRENDGCTGRGERVFVIGERGVEVAAMTGEVRADVALWPAVAAALRVTGARSRVPAAPGS